MFRKIKLALLNGVTEDIEIHSFAAHNAKKTLPILRVDGYEIISGKRMIVSLRPQPKGLLTTKLYLEEILHFPFDKLRVRSGIQKESPVSSPSPKRWK